MLDNDMIEFLTYRNAMKSNYRKGVHALRCILNNRKQAETFAGSLGGVSLVLGVSQPDGNSEALRALLEGSAVIDQATLTWLKNWWPEQCGSWDTLAADQGRCNAIATDPFLWERVGASPVGAGKILAGLVGQDSRNFAAMQAVASSATAMQAVASSATAMQAVASSATAMQAVASSATAMQAVASSATAMQAVAVSPVAIAAIYRSDVALSAVDSEVSAAATFYGADSVAMGKAVVILAGLDPAGYADMSAVAASATAMSAVAASATAMSAVAASATAMSAVAASATAMSAVAASATAMSAVAASATAMSAVAASATAMSAVAANYVALVALYSNAEALSIAQGTTVGAAALAGAGSVATGKAAVKLAGLDPDDFADMAAVAASSTAMAAVAASSTAMAAVAASSTAMAAVAASSTAMAAVAASSTAMAAVAASSTAMAAVAASATARSALNGASVARQALKASPLATELSLVSSQGQYWNNPGTKAMKGLILATKAGNSDNAFSITKIDSTSTGAGQNTRNAATSGSTGYLDWYENYPNYAWVMNSITYYAYYTTTKIKYIPC